MKTRDDVLGYIERFEERQNYMEKFCEDNNGKPSVIGYYHERGNVAREILSGLREWWDE